MSIRIGSNSVIQYLFEQVDEERLDAGGEEPGWFADETWRSVQCVYWVVPQSETIFPRIPI